MIRGHGLKKTDFDITPVIILSSLKLLSVGDYPNILNFFYFHIKSTDLFVEIGYIYILISMNCTPFKTKEQLFAFPQSQVE